MSSESFSIITDVVYLVKLSFVKPNSETKYMCSRDGMMQGTEASMHHAKSIILPQYITAWNTL